MMNEKPVIINCRNEKLLGIAHCPLNETKTGHCVLIVVGGPQYRAGSHRQFVHLARALCSAGIPVMRFDYRGMGDSEGRQIGFEETGSDIKAAIDTLYAVFPRTQKVILWGLCDAASACLLYAGTDNRVKGMVLANPWVHTAAGAARTHFKHYYFSRLMQFEFWQKLISFKFEFRQSAKAIVGQLNDILTARLGKYRASKENKIPFQEKMKTNFISFEGQVLFLMSGNDLTAAEFCDFVSGSNTWREHINQSHVQWCDLKEADHTFSKKVWKAEVAQLTEKWLREL